MKLNNFSFKQYTQNVSKSKAHEIIAKSIPYPIKFTFASAINLLYSIH